MATTPLSLPGLKAARVERGLSRRELALKCGLSFDSITSYEIGRSEASIAAISLLSTALGVEPAALYETQPEVGSDISGAATA
jgi:transcriptional regulator with XRE-family HTH domain